MKHRFKVWRFTALIALFFLRAKFIHWLSKNPQARWRRLAANTQKTSAQLLTATGTQVRVSGLEQLPTDQTYLFVANHMSYLDALILATFIRGNFVTSVEMNEDPAVRAFVHCGGALLIERRHTGHLKDEIHNLAEHLRSGHNLMIFPEGTSTNGQSLQPFKRPFFLSAIEAGCPVVPVCLRYLSIDGQPFSPDNADTVCWYGEMEFEPHLNQLLKAQSIEAELIFHAPLSSSDTSSRELSQQAHQIVHKSYFSTRSPL